jgi:uncharacterized protein
LTIALLFVASVLTSAVSGVLGMAGGMALLGVMSAILSADAVVPLHGVVQLSSNATRAIVLFRRISWRLAIPYGISSTIGVVVATLLWSSAPPDLSWFQPLIGAFILVFLIWRRLSPSVRTAPVWIYPLLGFGVGLLGMFVGATGFLIAPFFLRDDLEKEGTIATMAAVQTWGHLLKIPAFASLGFDYRPHLLLLGSLLLATVIGTIGGKRALERLPRRVFEIAIEIVLAALAIHLILAS